MSHRKNIAENRSRSRSQGGSVLVGRGPYKMNWQKHIETRGTTNKIIHCTVVAFQRAFLHISLPLDMYVYVCVDLGLEGRAAA